MMVWNDEKARRGMEQKKKQFLHAAGMACINQMAAEAHIDTGLLKNSMHYETRTGEWSGFQTLHGPKTPPADARVGKPADEDYVRCGSALVYAGPQERHNGWCSRALDRLHAGGVLTALAKRVFGG